MKYFLIPCLSLLMSTVEWVYAASDALLHHSL